MGQLRRRPYLLDERHGLVGRAHLRQLPRSTHSRVAYRHIREGGNSNGSQPKLRRHRPPNLLNRGLASGAVRRRLHRIDQRYPRYHRRHAGNRDSDRAKRRRSPQNRFQDLRRQDIRFGGFPVQDATDTFGLRRELHPDRLPRPSRTASGPRQFCLQHFFVGNGRRPALLHRRW